MKLKANIFWCTGMSGAGKSTLANHAKCELQDRGFNVLILDGDTIREKNDVHLGFGRADVEINNLNIAQLCMQERSNYDVIIVPIISPIDSVRCAVRELLSPGYYIVYISADINSLKERDPKGLYEKADNGELKDLIGYSDSNPYDMPTKYDFIIHTGKCHSVEESKELFVKYILNI